MLESVGAESSLVSRPGPLTAGRRCMGQPGQSLGAMRNMVPLLTSSMVPRERGISECRVADISPKRRLRPASGRVEAVR